MNLKEVIMAGRGLYASRLAVELVSPPGIGKSAAVADIAADLSTVVPGRRFGLWTVFLSAAAEVDVSGMPVVDREPDGRLVAKFATSVLIPSVAPTLRVWRDGEEEIRPESVPEAGIVFLDEFLQAADAVRVAAAPFVLSGVAGQNRLQPGWRVWMASNRSEDRSGVAQELAFLRNRRTKIEVVFDTSVFEAYAARAGLHPAAAAFSRLHAAQFAREVPEGDEPFCTPRTLELALRYVEAVGEDPAAMSSTSFEVVAGLIGRPAAYSLFNVLELAAELPSIQDVLDHPESAPVPDSYGARVMLAHQLATRVTPKQLTAAMAYLQRLPKELQIMGVVWLRERLGRRSTNEDVIRWLADNADLIAAATS